MARTVRSFAMASNDSTTSSGQIQRFHQNHAPNIVLEENGQVAYRASGFGNGVVFSGRYLHPGELFVVEIEGNEKTWFQGCLRLGLTTVNPLHYPSIETLLTLSGVGPPHMFYMQPARSTWVFRLTDLESNPDDQTAFEWPYNLDKNKVDVREDYIRTCYGSYPRMQLRPTEEAAEIISDLEVGCKVGVVYLPYDEHFAELYYVVNGNVFGPYALDIPYEAVPLYAMADLYGRTTRIRLLPLRPEKSLKQFCRMTILKTHDMRQVSELHLPKSIRDYLNFNAASSTI